MSEVSCAPRALVWMVEQGWIWYEGTSGRLVLSIVMVVVVVVVVRWARGGAEKGRWGGRKWEGEQRTHAGGSQATRPECLVWSGIND